ncbi:MAG: hypothetical protein MZV65_52535 [Chromatiales bacterium]|nr:hypothetical protein [Chromatiales bacterium]
MTLARFTHQALPPTLAATSPSTAPRRRGAGHACHRAARAPALITRAEEPLLADQEARTARPARRAVREASRLPI